MEFCYEKNRDFPLTQPVGYLDFCKAELRAIVSMHAGLRIGGEEEDQVRAGVGGWASTPNFY